MKSNAAKYNNFIRSGSSISPTRKPGDSPTRGARSTISSRFGGSQYGGASTAKMKHAKSTAAIKPEFMPLGSAIARQRAADKLESGSKKKLRADMKPSEELFKFPTLGQISKMGQESPLSKLVYPQRQRQTFKSEDMGGFAGMAGEGQPGASFSS